jgi:hypothetical protein
MRRCQRRGGSLNVAGRRAQPAQRHRSKQLGAAAGEEHGAGGQAEREPEDGTEAAGAGPGGAPEQASLPQPVAQWGVPEASLRRFAVRAGVAETIRISTMARRGSG